MVTIYDEATKIDERKMSKEETWEEEKNKTVDALQEEEWNKDSRIVWDPALIHSMMMAQIDRYKPSLWEKILMKLGLR